MKFTLVAALAAVKAAEPNFAAEADAIAADASQGDAAPISQVNFQVYAEDNFSLYVNGNIVLSGQYNYRDASTWAFSGAADWRDGYDSLAVEVDSYRGDGLWTALIDGVPIKAAEWRCIEVHDAANVPDGWNTNSFNDDGWADPYVQGVNTRGQEPYAWRGWTNDKFPAESEYIWVDNWRAEKVLCRYNQRPFAERESDSGVCDAVIDEFVTLVNEAIGHYQGIVTGLEANLADLDAHLAQENDYHHDLNEGIQETQGQWDQEKQWREEENQAAEAAHQALLDANQEALEQLEADITAQCGADTAAAIEAINTEYAGIIAGIEADHAANIVDINQAHDSDLENALDTQKSDLNDYHTGIQAEQAAAHEAEVQALKDVHQNTQNDLNAQWAGLNKQLNDAHDAAYAAQAEENAQEHAEQTNAFEKILAEMIEDFNNQIEFDNNRYSQELENLNEVKGDEIEELQRKHDYLYEACTTVDVVDGELHIE